MRNEITKGDDFRMWTKTSNTGGTKKKKKITTQRENLENRDINLLNI